MRRTLQPRAVTRGRRWRRDGIALWTGDKFHGACFWPWRGELVRLQCWTYPRDRIVTFRKSRTVEEAKRVAERWLSQHTKKGRKPKGGHRE